MTVKLLTKHHLEFISLNEAAQAHMSLHMSKCHIVGNHMLWFNSFLLNKIYAVDTSVSVTVSKAVLY